MGQRSIVSAWAVALGVVLMADSAPSAKAVISIGERNFKADTVAEGTKDLMTHVFAVKNSGVDTLKIKSVRPG